MSNARAISILALSLALFTATAGAQVSAVSPTPMPSPTAVPTAVQSLNDLQFRLRQSLAKPEIQRGSVGVKISSLATGKVVFEENAEKYFMPASNMKNFTVAATLDRLGPDFRLITSLYAANPVNSEGTLGGDLVVFGRGDVSISTRFNGSDDPMKSIDPIVDKLIAAGIKKIDGSIVGDDSYFRGFAIPQGWEWDDLQSYFGAEVSALPVNDNAVDLSVTPGPVGYSCSVKLSPYNPIYRIKNSCITTAAGSPRTLRVHKVLGQNLLEISGTLPIGNAGFKSSVAVTRPAELFAALVRQRLVERGVAVTGQYRVPPAAVSAINVTAPSPLNVTFTCFTPGSLMETTCTEFGPRFGTLTVRLILSDMKKTVVPPRSIFNKPIS